MSAFGGRAGAGKRDRGRCAGRSKPETPGGGSTSASGTCYYLSAQLPLTVNVRRRDGVAAERFRGPGVDGDVWPADRRQDGAGTASGALQGGISVDGAQAEEVQGGMVRGEEDGEGILRRWRMG